MERRSFLKSTVAAAATMASVQVMPVRGMPWIQSQSGIEAIYILESAITASSVFAHGLAYLLSQEVGSDTIERVSIAQLVSVGVRPESVYVGATFWSDWELFSIIAGAKTTWLSLPFRLDCGASGTCKSSALALSSGVNDLLLGRQKQDEIKNLLNAGEAYAESQPGVVFAYQLS